MTVKPVKVKNIEIGAGIPKICVPVVGNKLEEIVSNAKSAGKSCADLVEWRFDYYENVRDKELLVQALELIKNEIIDKPLLCTFRTAREGGEQEISTTEYIELYETILKTGLADIIDVELLIGDEVVRDLIEKAHEKNIFVLISNHDFDKTPEDTVLTERFRKMQDLGGDIAKIAVMPSGNKDVLRIMMLTSNVKDMYMNIPVVTMSMGQVGIISRMAGEISGSDMTFASVTQASAPGQIDINILSDVMKVISGGSKNAQ